MSLIDKYFIKKPKIRRFVTSLLYKNHDFFINLFDTRLFINSLKENGYFRAHKMAQSSSLFRDEVSVLLNVSNIIDKDSTFVDVGANVGLFCSTVSRFQAIYPSLKIYAFEANPDTYNRLANSIKDKNIEIFNYAISNQEEELEFLQGAVSHVFAEKAHSNSYHFLNQKTIKIPAKRLDQFEIQGNSIVLKIDVEGHEYEVLEGATSLFDQKRIKAVYLDGYKNQEVVEFLKRYNFTLLNGRDLSPLQNGEFSLLALRS